MAPVEREASRDADRPLRHRQSMSSDQGRALVPMWDSSDPDRAPPPLPMNPQSPVTTSRKGTSVAIQSAHAALNERARESAMLPAPLTKRNTETSPERSLIKGSHHKRMQSLQPGNVRDLSLLLESGQQSNPPSPTKSPERTRPSTPAANRRDSFADTRRDSFADSRRDSFADLRSTEREATTPSSVQSQTPVVRPTIKRQQQSILGENTPPQSATMLAIQNMPLQGQQDKENVANGSTALVKAPQQVEALSGQILSLTSIATALQKDMAQLSRRSRDNATDLLSLKEATKARDEDIRKSLRELINNAQDAAASSRPSSRDPFVNSLFLDTKPHHTSPPPSKAGRPFSLPRIPSPNSFAASIDRDALSTPSLCNSNTNSNSNSESPTTIAILDKIIRDMGTKEGHDLLLARLTDVAEKLAGVAPASKVEELIQLVKTKPADAMISRSGGGHGESTRNMPRAAVFDDDNSTMDFDYDPGYASQLTHRSERALHNEPASRSAASGNASEIVSEEVLKIIRTVKDSVAQGGGLTAEVKALVRELRGEVLGMGREIGRRLDEAQAQSKSEEPSTDNDEVSKIVHEGIEQMRENMDELLREHRRQSANSVASRAPAIDYQEIYNAMRAALRDSQASQEKEPDLNREDVIEAVRDAWENYKPETENQDPGLGREEILEYLKEGLQDYVDRDQEPVGASREEVFQAVVEGLKHFSPPRVETPTSLSRDEILEAVRECLEEFEFPVAPSAFTQELTREDMLHAVKEGLSGYDLPTAGALVPHQSNNEEVVTRLQDILEYMRGEFRAVTEDAKVNAAANGRDTEQILDATKDGLEKLRADMEAYVSHLSGSTAGQEEITQTLVDTLDTFRDEMAMLVDRVSSDSRSTIESHMESLRDTVNSSMVPVTPQVNQKEIIEAVRDGIDSVRGELRRPFAGVTDILDALHDGLADLRISIDKVANRPADLTANDEVLDALKAGLDNVRSEIDGLRELQGQNDKALTTMHDGAVVPVPADALKQDDIKNLEVLITQLRIKIEAMEPANADPVAKDDLTRMEDMLRSLQESASKDDMLRLEDMLRLVQESVSKDETSRIEEVLLNAQSSVTKEDITRLEEAILPIQEWVKSKESPVSTDASTKEDVQAIETILRNTKGRLDDLIDNEQAVRKEHLDSLENTILETREAINLITTQLDTLPKKDDVTSVEALVTQVAAGFEEMKESAAKQLEDPERVTKTDVEAVEAACHDIKDVFDQLLKTEIATLVTKEDLKKTETTLEELKGPLEALVVLEGLKEGLQEGMKAPLDELKTELKTEIKTPIEELKAPLEELKTRLDSLVESHDKGSEERQAEIVGVSERVTEVKTFLEEFQGLVKGKLEEGATGVESLSKLLEGVSTAVENNASVNQDLKDLSDTMKLEFEESKAAVVGAKLESDEKFQQTTDALSAKIEEKVTELMTKYDEFHVALDDRAKAGEARDASTEEAVLGTKAVAEELKSLVDTLGAAVTDSMEKMEEASKTVFTRVEDLMTKSEENHTDGKADHQQTRDHLKQAVDAVEIIQGQLVESQPQILESIKDVLLIVGQHYDYAKTSTNDIQKTIEDAKPVELALPPIPDKYDDTVVLEKLTKLIEHSEVPVEKYDDAGVHEKLDKLVEHASVPAEKYDDAPVHEKLDKIVEHVSTPAEKYDDTPVHEKLDKLVEHSQVPVEKYDDAPVHEKLDKLVEQQLLIPTEKYDDAPVHEKLDKLVEHSQIPVEKYDDAPVHEKLDMLVEHSQVPVEKYDDAPVHEKLDKLSEQQLLIPTEKYDDTVVQEKLDRIAEYQSLLPTEKYDDAAVQEKLDMLACGQSLIPTEKYDDTPVHEKLDKLAEQQLLIPTEKYDDTIIREQLGVLAEQQLLIPTEKYDDAALQDKLDKLAEQQALIPTDKYDDAAVHVKLDELVDHSHAAEKAFGQLDTLEKVHQQVIQTATDISLFLASQTKKIKEEEDDREQFLQEVNIDLERKLALKEQIEASLLDLKQEEERLRASVLGLRTEQESLIRQKTRLTGDVSSLETALHIRRDELHDMESRAEGLERRILEGVMDHSRVLLMSKATKGRDAMSRKRVRDQKPGQENEVPEKPASPAVNLALSAKRNLKPPSQAGAARRILSLSQITNNVPTGGVQRSQSVRTAGARGHRKSSWAGGFSKGYGDLDKENISLKETEEENMPSSTPVMHEEPAGADDPSDTETLRRSSHGSRMSRGSRGTTVVTESTENYTGDGDYSDYYDDNHSDLQSDLQSEWTESVVSSNVSSNVSSDLGSDLSQETLNNEVAA
ncbi:chromosome segregation ATPase [Colletotrichum tamarilloi]|uniref:Chromosome segregation ATPase n=1 Tax=Colletotrichum tamarilloi TaxID=1209934 RepID=A0ABQ9R7N6_9PEZI|nr:chromosome segregation ATPase [Colletotrichum tamarilloi]KAK1497291.1 chromosome segregation ATPase [Colletotrichum tamarilloi]